MFTFHFTIITPLKEIFTHYYYTLSADNYITTELPPSYSKLLDYSITRYMINVK